MRNRKSVRRSPVRRRIRLLEWLLPVLVLFLYGGVFLIPISEKSRTGRLIETVYHSATDAQVEANPHGGVAWGDRQALQADTGTAATAGSGPSTFTIETEGLTRRSAGNPMSLGGHASAHEWEQTKAETISAADTADHADESFKPFAGDGTRSTERSDSDEDVEEVWDAVLKERLEMRMPIRRASAQDSDIDSDHQETPFQGRNETDEAEDGGVLTNNITKQMILKVDCDEESTSLDPTEVEGKDLMDVLISTLHRKANCMRTQVRVLKEIKSGYDKSKKRFKKAKLEMEDADADLKLFDAPYEEQEEEEEEAAAEQSGQENMTDTSMTSTDSVSAFLTVVRMCKRYKLKVNDSDGDAENATVTQNVTAAQNATEDSDEWSELNDSDSDDKKKTPPPPMDLSKYDVVYKPCEPGEVSEEELAEDAIARQERRYREHKRREKERYIKLQKRAERQKIAQMIIENEKRLDGMLHKEDVEKKRQEALAKEKRMEIARQKQVKYEKDLARVMKQSMKKSIIIARDENLV